MMCILLLSALTTTLHPHSHPLNIMRFTPTCAALILAALPIVAAMPAAEAEAVSSSASGAKAHSVPADISRASRMNFTQFSNITEPARNTTGLLMSIVEGSIKPFPGHLGGSSSIDWKDDAESGQVGGE